MANQRDMLKGSFTLALKKLNGEEKKRKKEKHRASPQQRSTDAVLCRTIHCPLRYMGQWQVDSWVREGTRAVRSQCSGPPYTLVRMVSVPTSLTTWPLELAKKKRSSYINTQITSYVKKHRTGDLTIQFAHLYPSHHTQYLSSKASILYSGSRLISYSARKAFLLTLDILENGAE